MTLLFVVAATAMMASIPAFANQQLAERNGCTWGDDPMPPNPQVEDEDLKQIIAWVLSLK